MSDSYEKGLKLEELVTFIFKNKGYNAKHNVKLTGRSGVKHQIDVFAEYKAPLHVSKIIVECKSYDKPIDKDIVMKLIHEVEDLGVDRGILVTTSYFTPDAVSTAEQYNVDLWDGIKLKELLKEQPIEKIKIPSNLFYTGPLISVQEAVKRIDKELRGMFGRRGNVEESHLVFYPYYEVDIDARIYEEEGVIRKKVRQKIVSVTVLIDALTGWLCDYEAKNGIVGVLRLPELSDEEVRVFRMLSRGNLTTPALASMLSCSTAKARRIVQGLVAKGIAGQQSYKRQTFYYLRIKVPNPLSLRCISSNLKIENGEPKEEVIKISPTLSLEKVEKLANYAWEGTVSSYKTILYPYYISKIIEKEKKYIKAIDMVSGKVNERISEIFTSEMIFQLRKP